jgi:thiol peroxidase
VTLKGKAYTLIGGAPEPGAAAPEFVTVDRDLCTIASSALKGRPCLIASVLSLDTPVCSAQTRRLNQEALDLGQDAHVVTVSMDLPFALHRWHDREGDVRVLLLSDHRDASFGTAYGLLIGELHLLARAVFVTDARGILRHREVVRDLSEQPDYDAALDVLCRLSQGHHASREPGTVSN